MSENKDNTNDGLQDINNETPQTDEVIPGKSNKEKTTDSELHGIMYGGEYSEYGGDLGAQEEEETEKKRKLSTFRRKKDAEKPAEKHKTLSQKKLVLIIAVAVAVILITTLVLVFAPDLFGNETVDSYAETYHEDEVAVSKSAVLIYDHVVRYSSSNEGKDDYIQRIQVHNAHGDFVVYYNMQDSSYYFEGLEGATYDEDLFSQLIVSTGYALISDRFMPADDRPPLSEYGLDPADDPAYYILTTGHGKTFKLYIGKPSLTEDYYYCMLEGRDIVYILGQSISTTLLADVKTMISPVLTYPISDNSYLTEIPAVYIVKDGAIFVQIQYQDDAVNTDINEALGVTVPYVMVKPVEYDVSTTRMQTVLSGIVNMTGTELVAYNIYDTVLLYDENGAPLLDEDGEQEYEYVIKEEYADAFDLKAPAYDVYYKYGEVYNAVTFSHKQKAADGSEYYYVASLMFGMIAKVDASTLGFLEWDVVDFLDKPIFSMQIDKVDSMEVKTSDNDYTFRLTGIGDELVVIEQTYNPGQRFDEDTDRNGDGISELRNFRKFYQTILSINREDFLDGETISGSSALLAELIVTQKNGDVKHYKFYAYSNRRCFMTINDEGEFYVLRSMVVKMVNDAQRLMDGSKVDPNAES